MKKKMTNINPKLIKEWHPKKNGSLSPNDFSAGSNYNAWWLGECGHEWHAKIKDRSKGTGCPICSGKKIIKGINDLATKQQDLMADWDFEKNTLVSPYEVSESSGKKVWWKCHKCGYEWPASISHRSHGRGCPNCAGMVVIKGINDFESLYPFLAEEWDYEKNNIKPDQISRGSNKKHWWKCPNGHEPYLSSPYQRSHGAGCPICNKIFQTSFPEQAVYFYVKKYFPDAINKCKDIFKNGMELDIFIPSLKIGIEYDGFAWHNNSEAQKRENKKYLLCKENGIKLYRIKEDSAANEYADITYNVPKFSYDKPSELNCTIRTLMNSISSNLKTDIDIKRDLFQIYKYKIIKYEDSLAALYPDLSAEWHQTLNEGLKPENVLPGSTLKVWWRCSNGHEWKASVVSRSRGHGCDICAREQRKITQHETLISSRDSLIGSKCVEDWDYTKNKHNPDYYTKGSGVKVWWKCHVCGHEWRTPICDRTRDFKHGCPACSNRILVKGKNDLQTTNPELIKEWNFELNGSLLPSDVAQYSRTKIWWKCSKCGYSYQATPANRVIGKGCGCCAGRVVVPGINDLATTRPDIAVDWHPTKNGDLKPTDVTKGRRDMIWWKCHICGHEWQDSLNHRNGGRGCACCNKERKKLLK
ncbi:MAG: zinc-ribbon domain-containing protein [Bacilli bacterium]|nr:zinc-ribbon domain-containing protein [Bacilli bacterium]